MQGVKRRRIDHGDREESIPFTSANEIDQALRAHSSISHELKASVNRFKNFLASISKSEESPLQQQKSLQTLKDYCNLQTAPTKEHVDFPDLLSAWSKAVESGNDPVASAVPAALAQFFRTISGMLEFREFGLSLCYSLLKRSQIRLFDRGLSSPRTKEHLISPCLRLLTEITSFDGGTMANHVFNHRDVLYKRLDSLLDPRSSDVAADRRRPTVRRMTLRLVIANLQFLDTRAKTEYLAQHRTFRAVAQGLSNDGGDILLNIIKAIEVGVVDEITMSRASKLKLFTSDFCSTMSNLYGYEAEANHPESASVVRESIHKLLLKICTTSKGIVLPQNGWYPVGYELELETGRGSDDIDLGLDSPLYFDNYSERLPVKNTTISTFFRTLKPENDVLQAELLLKAFNQMPELVADYFTKPQPLSVAAGDDSQWRGRFAFLFTVVQAPVPKNLGSAESPLHYPPPISVVIESILPRPFDGTILTRFFSLNDEMLILAGSRLISVALNKLGQVLNIFERYESINILWTQASRRLVEAVLNKVPKYKDLTDAYHRCGKSNVQLRTALFECMASYHRMLPEAAASYKFDVGPILLESLQQAVHGDLPDQDPIVEQIPWLMTIAGLSPATKWWSKSDSDDLSLFTTALRFMLVGDRKQSTADMFSTLSAITVSSGLLNDSPASFSALMQSLTPTKDFSPTEELFAFLDNSSFRVVQKPVKYLDSIENEQQLASDKMPLGLLACGVVEQWKFALQKYGGQKGAIKSIAKWVARFFNALENAGENFRVLTQFKADMLKEGDGKVNEYLQSSFEKLQKRPLQPPEHIILSTEQKATDTDTKTTVDGQQTGDFLINLDQVLGPSMQLPDSLEDIDRWDNKIDIEHAVQSGKISRLIRSTASVSSEVRTQAFHHLQTLTHLVDESTHPEKAQIYLLLGELSETIRQHGLTEPMPSAVPELAVKLLDIISDPAHQLFSKANKFLLHGPSWNIRRLIPHWTVTILFTEPDSDEPHSWTIGVEWYTSWLAAGLKTPADMELYRTSGVFEKILALYSSPATVRSTQKLILTMLWMGICAGGTDTLITRVGVHAWLEMAVTTDKEHASIIRQLSRSLAGASDSAIIDTWEKSCPLLRKSSE